MIKELLQKDDQYAAFKNIRAHIRGGISVENVTIEIDSLFATRPSRKLSRQAITAKKLQESVAIDSSTRSRIAELRTSVSRKASAYDRAIKALKSHLLVTYASEFSALGYVTATERKELVDHILRKDIELLDKLNQCLEDTEVYLKDIDQCAYAHNHLVKTLEIILGTKHVEV